MHHFGDIILLLGTNIARYILLPNQQDISLILNYFWIFLFPKFIIELTPIVVNILLFIPVRVINPYQATSEGEYLTEGDEHAVVYLCQWRKDEPRHQQHASKDA